MIKLCKITLFFVAIAVLTACTARKEHALLYADAHLWYNGLNDAGEQPVDVFYILPTCVTDRVDVTGDTIHYADLYDKHDRERMRPSFELGKATFGTEANFYSPYYRQLALESWKNNAWVEARFPYAMQDVKDAFTYYMNNINQGRPFVLAGFSQGGKCVVELLKTLTAEQCNRLIAAYVVGYRITPSDTLNYKQIRPATCATDLGVTICYNSVANDDAISPILAPNAVCINPLNWKTTAEEAWLNDSVTVSVDPQHQVLRVEGFDKENYYIPSLDYLFKKGNYHLQELYFYKDSLAANVLRRSQVVRCNVGI